MYWLQLTVILAEVSLQLIYPTTNTLPPTPNKSCYQVIEGTALEKQLTPKQLSGQLVI